MRDRLLDRREHRHRGAAVAGFEDELDGLADLDLVEVAIDDVGHHRRALGQGDIGNRVRDRGTAHDAVSIDRAVARDLLQFCLVPEAEGAYRARIVVQLPTSLALADHQLALGRGVPERLGFEIGHRGLDLALLALHHCHSRSMITVAAPCRVPSEPPVPCAKAISQFATWTLGCASPRNWRTASTTLVSPPRFDGWLLHNPPPSVLNGNLPVPEIRFPSETNRPPWPFSQKPRSSICITTVIVKLS